MRFPSALPGLLLAACLIQTAYADTTDVRTQTVVEVT